jgi:GT2 family glycosyltransferase
MISRANAPEVRSRPIGLCASEAPDASVIIASYRCRDLLRACLDSLAADRGTNPPEVIVVDNASNDGTMELLADEYPWVRAVAAGGNIGFSAANNIGMAMASAPNLLLLNPDTVVPRGAIRAALAELLARPEVGMLGVKLVQPDGRLDHACKRGFPTPMSSLYHFAGLSRRFPRSRRFSRYTAAHVGEDEVAYVDAVNGAFMLVRREAVESVGQLDEDYWLYMEDLDWCFRFWKAGWKVLYWPRVEVVHVKGGSSGSRRGWKANHAFHRGMWLYYKKHQGPQRPAVLSVLVWTAIWIKSAISASRSVASRLFERRRTTTDS